MSFAASVIGILSASLLFLSAIAFLRAKDVFSMTHVVMIANFYIIPLILLAIEIEKFSLASFGKIIALIVLSIIVSILFSHSVVRRATLNKIAPDAK